MGDVLDLFTPATRQWFAGAFDAPTAAQAGAWRAAAAGEHALVVAPTGSGKTLAAFLWALDRLSSAPPPDERRHRCRVLYISPLKALAVDVQRNLRAPLAGIRQAAHRLDLPEPDITVGMRTGDTPAADRRSFARTPPDVLVTTPESLFLILTSAARESLLGVRTVIVDEVHAVAGSKRGAHLALSLERLDALLPSPAQRIGLSATVRPVDEVSGFLCGGRPVTVVQPPIPKTVEVTVEVPVEDMSALGQQQPLDPDGPEPPRPSIWPAVESRVLELVRAHRSTIVFANSRRLAEKMTARLNELADEQAATPAVTGEFPAEAIGQSGWAAGTSAPVVARAHHGSMSREQRTAVEEDLKSGRLPCVVATSSLELGIDMGAVDLVVQVEAPPTVASGMQRIGRAGHQVGAVSRGVVFPKFRGDLVSCAVVAERMAQGAIEKVRYPRNPLDVLAQHIVAMVALEPWTVTELATLVRRSAPFASLPESALHSVLDMIAGRYPSEEFGELRPRITWDRITGELRGRPGAQRLAVTSGGTIPDRGMFTVTTPPSENGAGSRVGELDEEMVYESRVGDTFLLGTSAWRVQDITHDRVIVTPAPGEPARMPFWKGDAPGRPLELGRALGKFVREVSTLDDEQARARASAAGLDTWACDNLLAYLAEQREATRHLPDDRTILVERFRDELGDWRLVVHSPFGAQVNAPWALAIAARLRERRGVEAQLAHSDDGIVVRLPDAVDDSGADVVAGAEDVLLDPEEIDQIVIAEVGGSALFAARFRECAARSLLLPRRDPGRRSPLWQQRQRSAQLLSVASKYESFPVVLEAMRECLQDVYDLAGLRELMSDVRGRKVRVVEVQTPSPSPFARSLLFGYVGMFLYETDAPLAERRAAALSLDSTLLAELLGSEAIRELLDADVLAEIEQSLQRLAPQRHARTVEEAADLLRFLGDLSVAEAALRGDRGGVAARPGTAAARDPGADRGRAAVPGDRGRRPGARRAGHGAPGRRARGVHRAGGRSTGRPAGPLRPHARPVPGRRGGQPVRARGVRRDRRAGAAGGHRATGARRASAGRHAHRVLRRRGAAPAAPGVAGRAASEVEPVEPAPRSAGSCRPGTGSPAALRGAPTADDVLVRGRAVGRSAATRQRVGVADPARPAARLLPRAARRADRVRRGHLGGLRRAGGRRRLDRPRPNGCRRPAAARPGGVGAGIPLHGAVLSALDGGALFFRQLAGPGLAMLARRRGAGPVRRGRGGRAVGPGVGRAGHQRHARRRCGRWCPARARRTNRAGRRRAGATPGCAPSDRPCPAGPGRRRSPAAGRSRRAASRTRRGGRTPAPRRSWSGTACSPGARWTPNGSPAGSAACTGCCGRWRSPGQVVRGYVVEGLGAAQFAARGAVDRLRALSRSDGHERPADLSAMVLAAADPAQPYGAALAWPKPVGDGKHRPARKAGALAVLVDGEPAFYVERGGRSLLSFTEDEAVLRAGASALSRAVREGWLGALAVQKADGGEAPHLAPGRSAARSWLPRHAEGTPTTGMNPSAPAPRAARPRRDRPRAAHCH